MEKYSNDSEMEEIYSPLNSYKNIFKEKHNENAKNFFENITSQSKVDIEANRITNKKIENNNNSTKTNNKSINKQNFLRILAFTLIALSTISSIIGIIKISKSIEILLFSFILIISITVIILAIVLINKTKLKLVELRDLEERLSEISQILHTEAEEQMRNLNSLLIENYNMELFTKTIPLVKFDKVFENKKLRLLKNKFKLNCNEHSDNIEESTIYVQSGDINGNPFFIRENLEHSMGSKTYKGSIIIRWKTIEKDSDGKLKTVNHSEILYATVDKPFPQYTSATQLIYGCEAGERLSFSREPSYIHELSDRKKNIIIKKKAKELQKLTEKATKGGASFTALGNEEFDALFYAKDRDDESQFRLLFTPLAQQELINIIKDDDLGFGDNFTFVKRKQINYLQPKHLNKFDLKVTEDYFVGINYDNVKKNFLNYHNNYFRNIFFAFAPIFAVPLYTQNHYEEHSDLTFEDNSFSFYQDEMIANSFDIYKIKPLESVTHNIIKTKLLSTKNDINKVNIHAWGYRTEERVEYVSKYGRDGNWHDVPVNWTEYILVERNSQMEVTSVKNKNTQLSEIDLKRWTKEGNIYKRKIK
jgi:hypothetical protein